jgi:hypothetical protein
MAVLDDLLINLEQALFDKITDVNFVQSVSPELIEGDKLLYKVSLSYLGEEHLPAIVLMDINPLSANLINDEMDWVTVYFKCYSDESNNRQMYKMYGMLREMFRTLTIEGFDILQHRAGDLRFPNTIRGEMNGSELLQTRAKDALRVGTYKHAYLLSKTKIEE